jgi:hypothetical protein
MKRKLQRIALNLKTPTTKVRGTTLDTNWQRKIIQGLAVGDLSSLSKLARNIRIRNPNTRIVKPRTRNNLSLLRSSQTLSSPVSLPSILARVRAEWPQKCEGSRSLPFNGQG